jgi:uncharacterized protein YecT (DUF1311 family)
MQIPPLRYGMTTKKSNSPGLSTLSPAAIIYTSLMQRPHTLLLFLASLVFTATLIAQEPTTAQLNAEIKRNDELHTRAQQTVAAEQARAKLPLCPNAKSTLDINYCYAQELTTTDANEVKLVRALGGLLRVGTEAPGVPPMRLNFDKAEATWHLYREQACSADGEQYEGGTMRPAVEMGCKISIARHHIDELWDIYNDLGTH